MKLVFYSGGHHVDNLEIDQVLINNLCTKKKDLQYTFIPSHYHGADQDFQELMDHYRPLGIKKFLKLEVDSHYSSALKRSVFKSDIIHLGGGNTYYFLKFLRKNKMLADLKKWVENGGVLTGLSAGAIIMTNNIGTASFPHFDCDENEDKMKNFNSMNLVDFEFFPHYRNSKRYDEDLISHSRKCDRPIYACLDGSGVIVNGNEIRFMGKTACFSHGNKFFIKK